MDETQSFPEPPATPPPSSSGRSRRTVALAASALVLCTAGGAIGGLAIGSALHGSSAANGTLSLSGNGYAIQVGPGFGGSAPRFQFPDGGAGTQQPGPGTTQSTSPATRAQLAGLVRIQTTLGYQNGSAAGTGMILSADGEVVTNHHVIAGATKIIVTDMSTGSRYQATVVGSDASEDIAVLKLAGASGLTTIRANSSPVSVGQSVTAVGDAQGASAFTASTGKVTAVGQTVSPSDGANSETLTGVIEYAADVMPGDSGGATYDSSGKVVGMTTAASAGGPQTNGYAVPIAKVLRVAADLQQRVSNSRYAYGLPAFIGVGVNRSAVVQQVYPGTGAAASGLAPGDRITSVDGQTVSDAAQLQTATRRHHAGQTVRLTWTTPSGKQQSGTVKLMPGPAA